MSATATLRRKPADRNVHVVVFTKRDGSTRMMRLQYQGGIIKGSMMQVLDLDKQAVRNVNLATVAVHGAIRPKQAPAKSLDVLRREMADLF